MERLVENARWLFDYDAGEPPDFRATGINVTVSDLMYQTAPERWIRAYLVAPAGEGPWAGLLFLHPGPGSRATFLAEAVALAGMGAVSLLVDAPWADSTAAA